MNTATLNIIPAYARRYKSAAEALRDWNAGKDFKIFDGPYLSKRDVPALTKEGYTRVAVHNYGKGVIAVINFEEK